MTLDPGNKASYILAGTTTVFGYLSLNQWALVIGIVTTLVVASVQVWGMVAKVRSQHRMEADARRHNRRMRDIERGDKNDCD